MGFLSCQICAPARERLEKADVEDVDVSVGQSTHFLLIILIFFNPVFCNNFVVS